MIIHLLSSSCSKLIFIIVQEYIVCISSVISWRKHTLRVILNSSGCVIVLCLPGWCWAGWWKATAPFPWGLGEEGSSPEEVSTWPAAWRHSRALDLPPPPTCFHRQLCGLRGRAARAVWVLLDKEYFLLCNIFAREDFPPSFNDINWGGEWEDYDTRENTTEFRTDYLKLNAGTVGYKTVEKEALSFTYYVKSK